MPDSISFRLGLQYYQPFLGRRGGLNAKDRFRMRVPGIVNPFNLLWARVWRDVLDGKVSAFVRLFRNAELPANNLTGESKDQVVLVHFAIDPHQPLNDHIQPQYGLVKDGQTSEVSKALSQTIFDVFLN